MSIRKVHLHKQEEGVVERGLQIRTQDPVVPTENQLWVDIQNKKINLYKDGIKIAIGDGNVHGAEETFVLTEQDIENKHVFLSKVPISGSLTLVPDGGIAQRKDIDFRVEGSKVDWAGASLDGFLEEGEVLQINYLFTD
jgi:hypothetical protein